MSNDPENLRQVLRRMPVPPPRPGFVDAALAHALAMNQTAATNRPAAPRVAAQPGRLRQFMMRWETWAGAALGAAVAATLTLLLLRPFEQHPQPLGIALALHETRAIDVLIDSERDLENATIRIAASGSIALDGFDDEREIDWQTDLERGSNLLSLPVVAHSAGKGRLVAIIEHGGRTRRVVIDLTVLNTEVLQS